MRRIRGIIESSIEPNTTDCIWIKGDEIKYHTNGRWTDVGESKEDRKELEEKVNNLDKEVEDLKRLGKEVDDLNKEVGGLKEETPYKIDWTDGTYHVNQLLFHPVYEITGQRVTRNDGLPILNYNNGHTIYGKLFVLNSSINDNELCYTQVLMLSNRIGGDGHTYIRTGRIQAKDSATIDALTAVNSPYWGTWESSVTTRGVLNIGSYIDLNKMLDNGLYTAIVQNPITLKVADHVSQASGKSITLEIGEGILVFTINNYSIFALQPSLSAAYNAGITQYIFRTKMVAKDAQYAPLVPIIIRSAHKVGSNWIWDDVSTLGITDESMQGGDRRLSLDALFNAMGYTYNESVGMWEKGSDMKTTGALLNIIAEKLLA